MDLSPLDASRLLFGLTACFHFLFVPLTLGLMAVIALLEIVALRTGRAAYREAARFWCWPFLLAFACGVLTGYPLRHQLATNWSAFSELVAPVFSVVFAFESRVFPAMLGLVALFAFGWRLPALWHALVSTALALLLVVQSAGILMLNAWMQHPVGTEVVDGQARITDLAALVANPVFLPKVLHTVAGAWLLGGVLVVSVSAAWLRAGRHLAVARAAWRVAGPFTVAGLLGTGLAGHWSGERLVAHQPLKFAAIEALWEAEPGHAPDLLLFAWPDMATRTNRHAVAWPGGLGWVVGGQPAFTGLRAATHGLPDVPLVFWSFRVMLGCWGVLALLAAAAAVVGSDARRPLPRLVLRACAWAWPLPWVATEAGWLVNEIGRQPWAITGVLTTRASLGGVTSSDVLAQLAVGVPVAALLLAACVAGTAVHVRRGPTERKKPPPGEPGGGLSDPTALPRPGCLHQVPNAKRAPLPGTAQV